MIGARDVSRGALGRYLGVDEVVLHATRQHPFALARDFLRMLSWFIPLLLLTWGLAGFDALHGVAGDWLLRAMLLLAAGVVLGLMQRLLVWEFERVVVTNEKVVHVSGVLQRRIASTPLAKVSEFTVHQTLVGRLLGFGSLVVDVPGGRDQALHGLSFIPDPAGVYRLVADQGRRVRRDEGGGAVADAAGGGVDGASDPAPGASASAPTGPGGYPLRTPPIVELDLDALDAQHPPIDHTIELARPDSLR